jgi:hypothetical protein
MPRNKDRKNLEKKLKKQDKKNSVSKERHLQLKRKQLKKKRRDNDKKFFKSKNKK